MSRRPHELRPLRRGRGAQFRCAAAAKAIDCFAHIKKVSHLSAVATSAAGAAVCRRSSVDGHFNEANAFQTALAILHAAYRCCCCRSKRCGVGDNY